MRKIVLFCGILLLAYTGSIAQQQASVREIRSCAVRFANQLNVQKDFFDKSIGNDMNGNGSLLFGDKIDELKKGKGVKE